ncbi:MULTISPECIES: HPr family phosphocarrier protein [Halanaerobium]|jgi:phosphocarrier protein|uniref:Phosphocarrier protein HPr n=1 Tax=Halanaerobium kushneri TaxID=56779 RepID=A0A1N6ZPX3_9FIRM|nr:MULTISPECIES: HPr family phosphocarrier protein [Halanaerobium]KXS49760.1 MAG: phosphocarrier protein [Halanaerobium sp. T82-1]PUU90533.1 MAG: phosphocarrier protein [Halanaerobium sp.]RCW52978.1 phosphocarrier protein [Halanaerobium sp. ST460_2HS_T2]SIR28943.1 phosphocarrier protein [Halanaerobium kushneri]
MKAERNVEITNATGLHARPASKFVQKAGTFKSDVKIVYGEKEVNAKSIMGVLSLGVSQGNQIKIKCEGEDAETALEELINFLHEQMAEE